MDLPKDTISRIYSSLRSAGFKDEWIDDFIQLRYYLTPQAIVKIAEKALVDKPIKPPRAIPLRLNDYSSSR